MLRSKGRGNADCVHVALFMKSTSRTINWSGFLYAVTLAPMKMFMQKTTVTYIHVYIVAPRAFIKKGKMRFNRFI